ncbi:hypothetical protein RUM44_009323 [Polyplax serrata]|uniref:BTB domain-containing protein n=1 Tax=Polyplax serrata TaxID=468196 RepID=A0ABR1ASF7_POLSC
MGTMESEQFFLKWNNFENNLTSGFADLLKQEAMVDVTLAAEGKIIQAHKVILSICSSYFRNMFQLNPCQHPIVVLKDVGYQELTDMLDFMYKGEANVRQEDLPSFLKLAETLKVKGLAGSQTESEDSFKKSPDSNISSLTKYPFSDEKDVLSSDTIEEDIMLRKKRKRPILPYKNPAFKSLPYSQSIKVEIEDCEDPFTEDNVGKVEQNIAVKGERLSDSSLYSYEYNTKNEKDAGPSNLDDGYETIPQGKMYDCTLNTDTGHFRYHLFAIDKVVGFVESEENEQASFSNLVVFQLRLPRKQIGMQVVRKNIQSESKDGNSICQVPPTFCPSNPKKRRWNPMICTLEFQFRFNPKRVPIWDFYTVNYDYEIAVCKVCKKIIKTRRKDGTRNVLSHMRNLHPEQYALALQYKEQWKSMKRRQCFDLLAPDN